ncbi:MAG: FAD-dependent monooxygenase [Rhizobiaceae bacterium]|nr:FAD-dependent monooxygenase [Rhizobiaceae bacterium]
MDADLPILVAGAGIAGLTAALALAARGIPVVVLERAHQLSEIGAGLQLSPNATSILRAYGVTDALGEAAVQPRRVRLMRASDLGEIAHVPLGSWAEQRWGAPYLTAHRADLQAALLECVRAEPKISLVMSAKVEGAACGSAGPSAEITGIEGPASMRARMIIAADGVWSGLRRQVDPASECRFAGRIAWRVTLNAGHRALRALAPSGRAQDVVAVLDSAFHLVAYPMGGGQEVNLVAFTAGTDDSAGWSGTRDPAPLQYCLQRSDERLAALAEPGIAWTSYPMYTVISLKRWFDPGGLVLVGDAAHAMTPFAAQGAAMAIEDAETLADALGDRPASSGRIVAWQAARRERVARVARRGALNHLAWSALGPVALARDLLLRLRPPESLAADLDWLYGWRPPAAGKVSAGSG